MYTRRNFSLRDMLLWTRHDILAFLIIATLPVVLYENLEMRWLHLPWLPIALVGTAVAFIIGFQNNASYGRTWEARKIWGGITNASRSWAMTVRDFVTNQFTDNPVSEAELQTIHRELVHRHVAWLTALRYAMRQPRTWEDFLSKKSNREWWEAIGVREQTMPIHDEIKAFMPEAECSLLAAKANLPAQILAIQSKRLRELRERGLIEDFRHMELQGMLTNLIDLQGRSERIKNFPYPRQYATLNKYFLWIFVVLLPFGVMHEFSKIGEDIVAEFPTMGPSFVWLSIPFTVIVCWVFHTMERIGRVTENPFEGSANDVPISSMSRGMEIDMRQILDEDPASIPEPIGPIHDTLM